MSSVLSSLKAFVVGLLATEPVVVTGLIVAGITSGLAALGLSLPLTIITTIATVLIGAVTARLKVTPVVK